MEIKKLVLGPLRTNCYFVINNKECIVIDPATNSEKILDFAKENNVKIKAILLTHGHFDHCSAVKNLQETGIKVYCSEFDYNILKNSPKDFGLNPAFGFAADFIVNDNQEINLIGIKVKVISTAGHTEGSTSYLIEDNLFCGDTLFAGGNYGRCDLFSGNFEKIKHSIKEKLFVLNNDIKVYSGHGDESIIGIEKKLLNAF